MAVVMVAAVWAVRMAAAEMEERTVEAGTAVGSVGGTVEMMVGATMVEGHRD